MNITILSVFAFFMVLINVTKAGLTQPSKKGVSFIGLPEEGKAWKSGEKFSISMTLNNPRFTSYFLDENTKVYIQRHRWGVWRQRIEIEGAKIEALPDNARKAFKITGVVPDVKKEGKFYLVIRRPTRRTFKFMWKTIATSKYRTKLGFKTHGKFTVQPK